MSEDIDVGKKDEGEKRGEGAMSAVRLTFLQVTNSEVITAQSNA